MDVADRRVLSGVVYMMNSRGPSTEPCGTPQDNGVDEDRWPVDETAKD